MKHLVNQKVELHDDESLENAAQAMMGPLEADPLLLRPLRKADDTIVAAFAGYGFHPYPTVLTTTLFYDGRSDCFLKVLQPISVKKSRSSPLPTRQRRSSLCLIHSGKTGFLFLR
jgi:hypothetical protein